MKLTFMRAVLALVGLGILGAMVVVSGVIPVTASSEHWPITRWFLDFSMARSVSTHSIGTDVPELDDPALVLRGAGHYEIGCRPCHGSPGRGRSEVVLAMTPHPPLLSETLHLWETAELFYIVRHGIKFTAMPAWPAVERVDEVWAMVAFLRVLNGLEPATYTRLALGDAADDASTGRLDLLPAPEHAEPAILEVCSRCHGPEGRGRGLGAFPALAGQRAEYLANSLQSFARGERRSGTMHPIAAPLEPEVVEELAAYFERQGNGTGAVITTSPDRALLGDLGLEPRGIETLVGGRDDELRPGGPAPEATSVERGARIARLGVPDLKVPSCVACHGPVGHPRNPAYPILAGQYGRYLVEQLELFHAGERGGSEFVPLMHVAVRKMTLAQMVDVAAYYASLDEG